MKLAEWLSLSGQTGGGGPSVVELDGQRLVEHGAPREAWSWDWLSVGGIERRGLVEEEVSLGRAASG